MVGVHDLPVVGPIDVVDETKGTLSAPHGPRGSRVVTSQQYGRLNMMVSSGRDQAATSFPHNYYRRVNIHRRCSFLRGAGGRFEYYWKRTPVPREAILAVPLLDAVLCAFSLRPTQDVVPRGLASEFEIMYRVRLSSFVRGCAMGSVSE